jgi:hypothetical protein
MYHHIKSSLQLFLRNIDCPGILTKPKVEYDQQAVTIRIAVIGHTV